MQEVDIEENLGERRGGKKMREGRRQEETDEERTGREEKERQGLKERRGEGSEEGDTVERKRSRTRKRLVQVWPVALESRTDLVNHPSASHRQALPSLHGCPPLSYTKD